MKIKMIMITIIVLLLTIGNSIRVNAEIINKQEINEVPPQITEKEEGQIEITKISAENNEKYNIKKGEFIPNVWYEIYEEETYELVAIVKTNEKGIALSKKLPCGYYLVKELQTVDAFKLDTNSYSVCIEKNNEMVKITSKSKVDEAYLDRKEERAKEQLKNLEEKEEQEQEKITTTTRKLPRTGF